MRYTSVVRCVYGVICGLAAPTVAPADELPEIGMIGGLGDDRGASRIATTAGSTQLTWPGQTGTAQRKQGGRVS